ncbi:TFIIB-type zinc ribbon-containing protein [Candidatus Woesearchaeota archaeon]|nr:TFIIB-type zinc ribbon-containing protein [Candidatus Woesearchaeota archaeon]MBU3942260.1 TFIIB-type zinc ribbon-containing protein [Nanoarchaeota archaeon]
MVIYEEWKKNVEEKLREVGLDKIPAVVKRCPKCNSLSLEFDQKTGRIFCTKCGFEMFFPK